MKDCGNHVPPLENWKQRENSPPRPAKHHTLPHHRKRTERRLENKGKPCPSLVGKFKHVGKLWPNAIAKHLGNRGRPYPPLSKNWAHKGKAGRHSQGKEPPPIPIHLGSKDDPCPPPIESGHSRIERGGAYNRLQCIQQG